MAPGLAYRIDERREELHEILAGLLGSRNVYFQPDNNTQLLYPCVVYNRERADSKFADNATYRYTKRYQVTVIDQDPNSGVPDAIAVQPMTTHERWFAVDNLNHDVFTMYF